MISIEREGRGGGGISDPLYVKHSNTIDQLLLNGLETPLLSCCGRLIRVFIISNKDLLYIFNKFLRIKRNVWVMFNNLLLATWLWQTETQLNISEIITPFSWFIGLSCHLTNFDLSTFNYDIHFTIPEMSNQTRTVL